MLSRIVYINKTRCFILFFVFVSKAVMLFGGWSRNVADYVAMYDLGILRNQLVSWGFAENHIQTFFANSIKKNDDDGEYIYNIRIYQNGKLVIKLTFCFHIFQNNFVYDPYKLSSPKQTISKHLRDYFEKNNFSALLRDFCLVIYRNIN